MGAVYSLFVYYLLSTVILVIEILAGQMNVKVGALSALV